MHWYMRTLEEVAIRTLAHFGVQALRFPTRTGVWTQGPENATNLGVRPRKIASIGVRISRWCTMHGIAVNVLNVSRGFALIHPCGFSDIDITSMEQEVALQKLKPREPFSVEKVHPVFTDKFCEIFECSKIAD